MIIQLDNNETLVKIIRSHWLIFIKHAIPLVVLACIPKIIGVLFSFAQSAAGISLDFTAFGYSSSQLSALRTFLWSLWLLALWLRLVVIWTDYYLDSWWLTTERILDVNQKSFFKRDVATLRLENIEDVTYEVKGVLFTLLDIGSLRMQTAGAKQEFMIEGVEHPVKYKDLIFELIDKEKEKPAKVVSVDSVLQ